MDEVRLKAAPARIRTADWYRIVDAAQALGLYTLATMVIGFGEGPKERTAHLLGLRAQQDRALERYENGFAAFALWTLQVEHTRLKGKAPGATAHEYLKTLAVARLALDNFAHFQASWPTLGFKVAQAALYYGADDFGSTMLEENVVSAAGGHGRTHATVRQIVRHIVDAGFKPAERDPSTASSATPTPRPSSASPSPWSSPSPKGSSPSGRGRSRCRPRPGRDRPLLGIVTVPAVLHLEGLGASHPVEPGAGAVGVEEVLAAGVPQDRVAAAVAAVIVVVPVGHHPIAPLAGLRGSSIR